MDTLQWNTPGTRPARAVKKTRSVPRTPGGWAGPPLWRRAGGDPLRGRGRGGGAGGRNTAGAGGGVDRLGGAGAGQPLGGGGPMWLGCGWVRATPPPPPPPAGKLTRGKSAGAGQWEPASASFLLAASLRLVLILILAKQPENFPTLNLTLQFNFTLKKYIPEKHVCLPRQPDFACTNSSNCAVKNRKGPKHSGKEMETGASKPWRRLLDTLGVAFEFGGWRTKQYLKNL